MQTTTNLNCFIPRALEASLAERAKTTGLPVDHLVQTALAQYLGTSFHTLFQVSTSGSLVAGVFDGAVSVEELLRHGDFGLGTLAGLDGEMVVLNGTAYQAKGDGSVHALGKSCPADETFDLELLSEDKLLLRHRIGSHPVEQVLTSLPVADFPEVPQITTSAFSLDKAARTTLLNALARASEDETRVILNGAYLDVSKPSSHYAVATDGRHLFASNSLHLALPLSVLIPDHRFLSWSGFVKDGQWKLAVQPPTKEKGGYLRLESRRWTFVTKQIEGTYPNWRNITEDVQQFTGTIDISDQAAEAINRIVPRLPGDDTSNHTVGLYTVSGRLYLRGSNRDQERATEVEVPGATISGDPATVYLNRQYLLKAISFGLRTISVQEPLKPLRFSDGGSRQMIVMPVRVDATAPKASTPAPVSVSPITSAASTDAPDHPTTNFNPPPEERNTIMQNASSQNGSGNTPAAETSPIGEKPSLEQALDQIEFVKGSLRGAVTNLNNLADTLRQVQRERRLSEREVRSVRDTLKSLQTVRL